MTLFWLLIENMGYRLAEVARSRREILGEQICVELEREYLRCR